ncbi:heavy metal translocating P-type ATPase [Agrilactobacillus fermenti]|uniref:heavy metal translocating P-type ATPase n=1 Tax=Agrilactobacillus fermenti TaxID=2586909 RepID=UPI003A5BF5CC
MHARKLLSILTIGVVALILQFALGHADWAQILITLTGAFFSFLMLIEMVKTLRSGKYGVDLLAISAVVATLAVGEYWASIVVLIMLIGGDTLEDYAAHRAGKELQSLLDNTPETAHILRHDTLEDVNIDQVQIGDTLVVRPGETVPVDGKILTGTSEVDEASLTGESRPVYKAPGDTVMSGSVNGSQALRLRAEQLATDSQYQKIVRLVAESQARPAKFVRLADRYAVPFTAIAYLIAGIAWLLAKDPVRFAQVLVVASPCPLILAAPIALVSGMSRASRNGVIVKSGTTIEKLATVKTAAFDKTGTLTTGQLTLDQIVPQAPFTKTDLLQYAASAEQSSNHVLARSLVQAAKELPLFNCDHLTEHTGQGIEAQVNGKIVKAGKLALADPKGTQTPRTQTAIYVNIDGQFAGYITFKDQIRHEAATTLERLKQQGVAQTLMITGDQRAIAETVGKQIGIDMIKADCLPEEKINLITTLPVNQHPVMMVGDGVNDAPALAKADVGVAMGAHGSTAASESADVVILKDDLSYLNRAMTISQDTMKVAKQAVWIGIAICIGLMLIASTGLIPAFIGAMFQEIVDTVSILWALKARAEHHKKIPAQLPPAASGTINK